MLIGGIEAGGTKMVCAVGDENGVIQDRISFPTRQPADTFEDLIGYFKKWEIQALGVGCFGPLDLNRDSATYGYITKTPKKGWEYCNIVGTLESALHVPVGFDTDVNGAVLGEVTWGAAKGAESAIYITVGTGVGVGVYVNGGLLHGLVHPEAGHIMLMRHPKDSYGSCCPFHKNCMEGLASGSAVSGRWGKKGIELADCDEVWELEAYYIGQAIANYVLTYSPEKIILWGGVMHQEKLFPMVRREVQSLLNGYISSRMLQESLDDYIVPPALGEDPGIMGAVKLGLNALL